MPASLRRACRARYPIHASKLQTRRLALASPLQKARQPSAPLLAWQWNAHPQPAKGPGIVAESSSEILEQIDREREELGHNLHQLERRLKRSFDLRGFVEERPMDAVVIGLGAGLFLSSMIGGGRRSAEEREMNETVSLISASLMSMGRKQLGAVVQSVKPGGSS
jgi:hypothetical protein